MLQAERVEFASQIDIEQVLLVGVAADEARERSAIGNALGDRGLHLTDVLGGVEFALGVAAVDLPVFVQSVLDLGKVVGAFVVVGRPVGGQ
ncbi:hypothetical protein D9M70_631710 [compost metagenome]